MKAYWKHLYLHKIEVRFAYTPSSLDLNCGIALVLLLTFYPIHCNRIHFPVKVLFFHLSCYWSIRYLERTSQYWHPNHTVVVKEIENMNKIKMALYFNHTMNFQNFGEKNKRRTELILEMKKMFDELNIKYDLLPQEVHLVEQRSANGNIRWLYLQVNRQNLFWW